MFYFGPSLNIGDFSSFTHLIHDVVKKGYSACQVSTVVSGSPLSGYDKCFKEVGVFKGNKIRVVSHAPLLTNLSSDLPKTRVFSVNVMWAETKRSQILGIDNIVLHPGSVKGGSPDNLIFSLKELNSKIASSRVSYTGNLLLENMVGLGNQILSKPEDFYNVFSKMSDTSNMGICLDTAHCFGAGFTPRLFLEELISLGLKDFIKVIHINNTLSQLSSKKEIHVSLLRGNISHEHYLEFLDMLKSEGLDLMLISEDPKKDLSMDESLNYVKSIFNGG